MPYFDVFLMSSFEEKHRKNKRPFVYLATPYTGLVKFEFILGFILGKFERITKGMNVF
jgi:hypothetical protein